MKLIVITTCDNTQHPGYQKLRASLEKFGYEHDVIQHPFSFGHQLPVIQHWAEQYRGDATHLLYTDAFDTLAVSGPDEVIEKFQLFNLEGEQPKMLISCEKNCYPHPERAKDYPETESPWKFVNGGGWLVEIEYFKNLCVNERLNSESHDQVWLMDSFLRNQSEIKLDTNCEIFQTIAFSNQEEWEQVENRFLNKGTDTNPIFFHGNGHTEMNWVHAINE